MPVGKVRSPKEILDEFISYVSSFAPGAAEVRRKPTSRGDTVVFIDAPRHKPGGSVSLNCLVDVSLSGSLYQEAAIYAANMTGKTLEQLGASEVFDQAMMRVDRVWSRAKETDHKDQMVPPTPKELPPEFQGDVATREGETTKSERIAGTADLVGQIAQGTHGTRTTEGHTETGEKKPKRRRGRPRKSDSAGRTAE